VDDQVTIPKQGRVTLIKGYDGEVSGRGRNEGKKNRIRKDY